MTDSNATRVAIYARVSTKDQHCTNQIDVLTQWCQRQGHRITKVYTDAGISGSKRRDRRPGLDAALKDAARAEYDLLAAFAVDRLGRSTVDLLQTLDALHEAQSTADAGAYLAGLDHVLRGEYRCGVLLWEIQRVS